MTIDFEKLMGDTIHAFRCVIPLIVLLILIVPTVFADLNDDNLTNSNASIINSSQEVYSDTALVKLNSTISLTNSTTNKLHPEISLLIDNKEIVLGAPAWIFLEKQNYNADVFIFLENGTTDVLIETLLKTEEGIVFFPKVVGTYSVYLTVYGEETVDLKETFIVKKITEGTEKLIIDFQEQYVVGEKISFNFEKNIIVEGIQLEHSKDNSATTKYQLLDYEEIFDFVPTSTGSYLLIITYTNSKGKLKTKNLNFNVVDAYEIDATVESCEIKTNLYKSIDSVINKRSNCGYELVIDIDINSCKNYETGIFEKIIISNITLNPNSEIDFSFQQNKLNNSFTELEVTFEGTKLNYSSISYFLPDVQINSFMLCSDLEDCKFITSKKVVISDKTFTIITNRTEYSFLQQTENENSLRLSLTNNYFGNHKVMDVTIDVPEEFKELKEEIKLLRTNLSLIKQNKLNVVSADLDISFETSNLENIELELKNKLALLKQKTNNKFNTTLTFEDLTVKKIDFKNLDLTNNSINLGIKNVKRQEYVQSYAIDPEQLDFDYAEVTVVAKGNELYKCVDYNFSTNNCYGEWKKIKELIPGKEYTFKLTKLDPIFGEAYGGGVVQRGTATGTTTEITATINSVNASKSFIMFTVNSGSSNPDDIQFTPKFNSATQVAFNSYSVNSGGPTINWQVIESDDLYVQRGTESLALNTNSIDVNIANINLSKSFILVYGRCDSSSSRDNYGGYFSANFTNSSRIHLHRGQEDECAATVSWQVIQWQGARVQSGNSVIADNSDSTTATITSTNTSNSFLIFGTANIGNDRGMDSNMIRGKITSSTGIEFIHEPGTTYASSERKIDWFVISLTDAKVQNGDIGVSADTTQTITSVNTSRSFHWSSLWNTGGGTTYRNMLTTLELTNSTTLTFDKQTVSQTSNIHWQVIELAVALSKEIKFNQTTLNLGNNSIAVGNVTNTITLDAIHNNNNILVNCVEGNCSMITSDWTNGTNISSWNSENISFTCENKTLGTYYALFNVTSNEDTTPDTVNVSCTMLSNTVVGWNQSTLDMGILIVDQGNKSMNVTINASKNNTNVLVNCISGNCSSITQDFINGTNISDGTTATVIFTCNNNSMGSLQATFGVTSNEDTITNNIVVSCEVNYANPKITLLTPTNNMVNYEGIINFTYNVSSAVSVSNCSLIIDNKIIETDSSITLDQTLWFSIQTLYSDDYKWSVNCSSSAGVGSSELNNLTIEGEIIEDTFTTAGNFSPDATNTAPWERGNSTQISGCYDDASCWGTGLAVNYGASGPYDSFLISDNFSLVGYDVISMWFYHYRYFEDATNLYDAGVLEIYNGTWNRLTPKTGYTGTVNNAYSSSIGGEQAYGLQGTGWELEQFNLSDYSGQSNLSIRFYFAVDSSVNDYGWFVDRFRIGAKKEDTGLPIVFLDYPTNGNTIAVLSSVKNVTFNCSATDTVGLTNISLYLTNSSNQSFSFNSSTTISGVSDSASWILELSKGDYTWNCLAYNSRSNSSFAENNYTFQLIGTALLDIFDTSDSETVEQDEQLIFFSNYTNTTSGAPINGSSAGCNVSFYNGSSWVYNKTMIYNSSSKLYEYNNSFHNFGVFNFSVNCFSNNFPNLTKESTFKIDEIINYNIDGWGIKNTSFTSTATSLNMRCMGGNSPTNLTNMKLHNISFRSSIAGTISFAIYYGGVEGDSNGATKKIEIINISATAGLNSFALPSIINWSRNQTTWVCWKQDANMMYYSTSSTDSEDYFSSHGRSDQGDQGTSDTSLPSSLATGAYGDYWYSVSLQYSWDYPKPIVNLDVPLDEKEFNVSDNDVTFNITVTDIDANLQNCTLWNDIDGTWKANETKTVTGDNDTAEWLINNIPVGGYIWNANCCDTMGHCEFNETNYTFSILSETDLQINESKVYFSESFPSENETITIHVNVSNLKSVTATNVNVSIYLDGNEILGQYIGSTIINVSGNSYYVAEINWTTIIGNHNITVAVDPITTTNGSIIEFNESNNLVIKEINVQSYVTFYGEISQEILLGDSANNTMFSWVSNGSNGGTVFVIDSDSAVDFYRLYGLGKTTTDVASSNDFSEIDAVLGTSNFNESIQTLWATDADNSTYVADYDITYKIIIDTPYIRSTTNDYFFTGILWDSSDDTNGEFDSTEQEDLVFIANIAADNIGDYGTYDYEIKVPALLREYKGSTDSLTFYTVLN